jgi:hypothetical protein
MMANTYRFKHHPDPEIDFCVEVDELNAMWQDVQIGFEPKFDDLCIRLERALRFNASGEDMNAVRATYALREMQFAVDARIVAQRAQEYMRRAAAELHKVHKLSERDAASIMLTVASVVSLGPKSAR